MTAAQVVLEYVRALTWPGIVLVALVMFRAQLASLLARVKSADVAGATLDFFLSAADARAALDSTLGEAPDMLPKAPPPDATDERAQAAASLSAALSILEDLEYAPGIAKQKIDKAYNILIEAIADLLGVEAPSAQAASAALQRIGANRIAQALASLHSMWVNVEARRSGDVKTTEGDTYVRLSATLLRRLGQLIVEK